MYTSVSAAAAQSGRGGRDGRTSSWTSKSSMMLLVAASRTLPSALRGMRSSFRSRLPSSIFFVICRRGGECEWLSGKRRTDSDAEWGESVCACV